AFPCSAAAKTGADSPASVLSAADAFAAVASSAMPASWRVKYCSSLALAWAEFQWLSPYKPVRGQHHQPRGVEIDEGHHHPIPGMVGPVRGSAILLVAPLQRGFVAVMAVGDHQWKRGHVLLQPLDHPGIGLAEQTVPRAVLVHGLEHGV